MNNEANKWTQIEEFVSEKYTDGETPDITTVLYLIGVQELGQVDRTFKKDDKINLMHIAVCTVLSPYGYYEFEGRDADGWPHFNLLEPLPELQDHEQQILMKKAVIQYFVANELI